MGLRPSAWWRRPAGRQAWAESAPNRRPRTAARAGDAAAGARPVLRGRALRQVNVDVVLLVEVFLHAELARARPHHRQRGVDRLPHHFAQLAGGDGLALARHGHRLDGQQLAADLGPGQAGDLSHLVLLFRHAEAELAHAEELVEDRKSTRLNSITQ